MTDNLRDRIANTLYQELSIELPAAIRGADAVIRELPELSTPIYQCPVCRHAYHYCSCHGGRR